MMSDAEFLAGLTGSTNDLALAVQALRATGQPFCLIGGLAVNRYAEPMVTLDADFAVVAPTGAAEALRDAGFSVVEFPHSLNATHPGSRLRIQITINDRYRAFPSRAVTGTLFGVEMPIACLADVVQGKLWAATDPTRRKTKRQKDAVDIARLAEAHSEVFTLVPPGVLPGLDEIRPQS
jgi:Nucleotidyl transferase AbiEii toxin, Type IV TA system